MSLKVNCGPTPAHFGCESGARIHCTDFRYRGKQSCVLLEHLSSIPATPPYFKPHFVKDRDRDRFPKVNIPALRATFSCCTTTAAATTHHNAPTASPIHCSLSLSLSLSFPVLSSPSRGVVPSCRLLPIYLCSSSAGARIRTTSDSSPLLTTYLLPQLAVRTQLLN